MVGISLLVVGWGKSWSPHGGPAHQAKSDCRPHGWLSGPVCRESGRVQAPKKCKCEPPRIVLAPSPVPQTHPELQIFHPTPPPAGGPPTCWGPGTVHAVGLELSSSTWGPLVPCTYSSFLSFLGRVCVLFLHHPADVEAAALWINLTVI